MGLKVLIRWPVDISFGLEELLSFVLNFAIEVIMENTNAGSFFKKACGWCGNALLRRSGDYFPIQARDGLTLKLYICQERAQGGSIPPLLTILS